MRPARGFTLLELVTVILILGILAAVTAEGRVRVAVDEPGDRAAPAAVELHDLAVEGPQVAHPPHRLDRLAGTEDVRVLEHLDLRESLSAQRRVASGRRRELREVADEQPRRAHASAGAPGIRSPPASAASIASG